MVYKFDLLKKINTLIGFIKLSAVMYALDCEREHDATEQLAIKHLMNEMAADTE